MAAVSQQLLLASGGGGGGGGATDPNFASVVFLAGFEGSNGATSGPGFNDESSANNKGGANFNSGTPSITTSVFKFGASSVSLPGGTGITWTDSNDFNFGSGLFTVECWFQTTTVAAGQGYICGQWGSGNQGWMLLRDAATIKWQVSTTGSNTLTDLTSGTISTGTTIGIAVDYDGTKYRLYIDGTMVASSTTARTIFNSASAFIIGANISGTSSVNGYVDEVRITKGVARYASDSGYTPATAAFPRS